MHDTEGKIFKPTADELSNKNMMSENDYNYCPKIEQIWTGPSHWKFKFVKPRKPFSTFRENALKRNKKRRKRKKEKEDDLIDFMNPAEREIVISKKVKRKRVDKNYHLRMNTIPLNTQANVSKFYTFSIINKPIPPRNSQNENDNNQMVTSPCLNLCPFYFYFFYLNRQNTDSVEYSTHIDSNQYENDNNLETQLDEIDDKKLIKAPIEIEDIYVSYVKMALQFNVKKLQTIMWTLLREICETQVNFVLIYI